jgi:hypothetical protein
MDIHNDKTLFKLIAKIFLIFSVLALIFAAIAGGLKAILFTVWIIFSCILFIIIIALSIDSGISVPSKKPLVRALSGIADFHFYQSSLGLLFILLAILSVGVWDYLDQKFPPKNNILLVSEIPSTVGEK